MAGQGMGEYCVDIVMCIDATASTSPIIDEVKNNAISFYQRFIEAMELCGDRSSAAGWRIWGGDPPDRSTIPIPEEGPVSRGVRARAARFDEI